MATMLEADSKPVVIVVDDDILIRQSLSSLFRSVDFEVVTYSSAHAVLEAELPDAPACLVIDVRMPQIGGFECHRQLSERGIHLPAIFLTGHGDIPMTVKAMKAGAIDFLTKPFREHDMLEAVYEGLSQAVELRATQDQARVLRERFSTLTLRERQVMAGVVRGRLNKQIADDIGVSEITVKLHRSSLMKKMAIRTVPDLVRAVDTIGPDFIAERMKIAA
jgi:FixJ family two-component response regulator